MKDWRGALGRTTERNAMDRSTQDPLIAATLAVGLFPRTPDLDAQKAAQIFFEVLAALQAERPKRVSQAA